MPDRFGRDDDGDGIVDYHWKPYGDDSTGHGRPPETYDPARVQLGRAQGVGTIVDDD